MPMLPPPTPMLPRLMGYAPEESLLLATVPAFDVDVTLDEEDFVLPRGSSPAFGSSSKGTPRAMEDNTAREKEYARSSEAGRAPKRDSTLDLDDYLPAADVTLLRDTSLSLGEVSLPPLLSPAYSPYSRPSSSMSWASGSIAGPSRKRATPCTTPSQSAKRSRTPLENTHQDDLYTRRMSDASRRASFGTSSFRAAEREDLRRKISRDSLRRASAATSLRDSLEIEYGRHETPRSESTGRFGTPYSHAAEREDSLGLAYMASTAIPSPQPLEELSVAYIRQATPNSPRPSLPSITDTPMSMTHTTDHAGEISEVKIESSRRMSTPAKVIGWVAGLLGRSTSSSRASTPRETALEAEADPALELSDHTPLEEDEGEEELGLAVQSAPVISRPPPSTTLNAPALRQPPPPKPAYPYVAPLTRPLGPRFATDARATRPIQTVAVPRPRPLAIRSQNKALGTSAFAKAALAKLPPPGRGSSAAGEKVHVKEAEHPRDFGNVRNVWERLSKENRPLADAPRRVERADKEMKRTVPIQGHTPGKASAARAKEREVREAIRKERREMGGTKGRSQR